MEVPTLSHLQDIVTNIGNIARKQGREPADIQLLAVTKTQSIAKITPLLEAGHQLFGENRVQEAYSKWPLLKQQFPNTQLHLIGHLQSNKVKEAVHLFDVIQTLDSLKLAQKLQDEQSRQNKSLEYYVEINIGNEPQKKGILPDQLSDFYKSLMTNYSLKITGIMCIPPVGQDPYVYFRQMFDLAHQFHLPNISMGMSDDYEQAIQCGSTMVRIGRALFI